ncbi:MAG: DNA polymerase III subunit chi [Burkholderiaceae bacterium]
MTEIAFHFNVPDRLAYACRLLRKATRQGARVAVTAPLATLRGLDRALWIFEPEEFVAHALLPAGAAAPERLAPTPVWLAERADDVAAVHEVLVNLGSETPPGFERYARLIEIVGTDEAERAAARSRWKHYAARGYALQGHEASG